MMLRPARPADAARPLRGRVRAQGGGGGDARADDRRRCGTGRAAFPGCATALDGPERPRPDGRPRRARPDPVQGQAGPPRGAGRRARRCAPTIVFSPGHRRRTRASTCRCSAGSATRASTSSAIDRPGHGLSEGRRGDCTIEQILDVVEDSRALRARAFRRAGRAAGLEPRRHHQLVRAHARAGRRGGRLPQHRPSARVPRAGDAAQGPGAQAAGPRSRRSRRSRSSRSPTSTSSRTVARDARLLPPRARTGSGAGGSRPARRPRSSRYEPPLDWSQVATPCWCWSAAATRW